MISFHKDNNSLIFLFILKCYLQICRNIYSIAVTLYLFICENQKSGNHFVCCFVTSLILLNFFFYHVSIFFFFCSHLIAIKLLLWQQLFLPLKHHPQNLVSYFLFQYMLLYYCLQSPDSNSDIKSKT